MSNEVMAALEQILARRDALREELANIDTELSSIRNTLGFVSTRRQLGTRRRFNVNSAVDKTVRVLEASREPLHVDEIIRRIRDTDGDEISKATLVSNLSRYVNVDYVFTRTGMNTFGLRIWVEPAPAADAVGLSVDQPVASNAR